MRSETAWRLLPSLVPEISVQKKKRKVKIHEWSIPSVAVRVTQKNRFPGVDGSFYQAPEIFGAILSLHGYNEVTPDIHHEEATKYS